MQPSSSRTPRPRTTETSLRALVEHDGWYVPLHLLDGLDVARITHVILPVETFYHAPVDALWVFTDREAAFRAVNTGAPIALGCGITGVELFGSIDPIIESIRIDHSLPTAGTLGLQQVAQLPLWAAAVRLERTLATRPEGWLHELVACEYFTLTYTDGELVRLEDFEGFASAGLLFTAIDAVDAFLAALPADQRSLLKQRPVSGRQFWSRFSQFAVDAIVINVYGPPDHHTLRAELGRELQAIAAHAM